MEHVTVTRVIAAPVQRVFDRYADIPSWNRWSGLGRVTRVRPGSPGPDGVGAVRAITTAGFRVEEEITAVDPPALLRYRLLRGMPLRNHEGYVHFAPLPAGTLVTWSCRFDPPVRGSGRPLRRLIAWVFTRALAGLAADLER